MFGTRLPWTHSLSFFIWFFEESLLVKAFEDEVYEVRFLTTTETFCILYY